MSNPCSGPCPALGRIVSPWTRTAPPAPSPSSPGAGEASAGWWPSTSPSRRRRRRHRPLRVRARRDRHDGLRRGRCRLGCVGRRHQRLRSSQGHRSHPPGARPDRPPRQQRRHRRPDRPALGGRRRRLVADVRREPPRHRPGLADGHPRDGRDGQGSRHQHVEPGRCAPLAARLGLLGVQGRDRQAHREPRPRDSPPRCERLQRSSRATARRA